MNNLLDYAWIEASVLYLVDTPIFFLPIFLISYWLYYTFSKKHNNKAEKKADLLFIFYSVVIALSINLIIQQFIHFDRPETALEATGKLLLSHIPDASFPSDHATVSISFLTGIFLFGYRTIGYMFLPFVAFMNISRVIVWVHWPLDIIWWLLIGIISAYFVKSFLTKNKVVKNMNIFIIKVLHYFKL